METNAEVNLSYLNHVLKENISIALTSVYWLIFVQDACRTQSTYRYL